MNNVCTLCHLPSLVEIAGVRHCATHLQNHLNSLQSDRQRAIEKLSQIESEITLYSRLLSNPSPKITSILYICSCGEEYRYSLDLFGHIQDACDEAKHHEYAERINGRLNLKDYTVVGNPTKQRVARSGPKATVSADDAW